TRLPSSPFQGMRSNPGISLPNFTHCTMRVPGLIGSLGEGVGPQHESLAMRSSWKRPFSDRERDVASQGCSRYSFSIDSAEAALLARLHVHTVRSERHWASISNWHVRFHSSAIVSQALTEGAWRFPRNQSSPAVCKLHSIESSSTFLRTACWSGCGQKTPRSGRRRSSNNPTFSPAWAGWTCLARLSHFSKT